MGYHSALHLQIQEQEFNYSQKKSYEDEIDRRANYGGTEKKERSSESNTEALQDEKSASKRHSS